MNTNPSSFIPYIRRACDEAARLSFSTSLLSSSLIADAAGSSGYARLCKAASDKLIIYLHTWSSDKNQLADGYPNITAFPNTAVVCPDFGGPNNNPYAMSDAALADIMAVITEMRYKTGLARVYLVGASGGGTMALNFMGKYPGTVHRASVWLPTYNLAQQYLDLQISDPTDAQQLQANMRAIFGHAPVDANDADYVARSPVGRLPGIYGPSRIFINSGATDPIALPAYGQQCQLAIQNQSSDCEVSYQTWPTGHVFDDYNAMKQLVLEDEFV